MATEVFEKIAKDIKQVDTSLIEAKELIGALRDVGEDTSEIDTKLRDLERKKVKWIKVLTERGYM